MLSTHICLLFVYLCLDFLPSLSIGQNNFFHQLIKNNTYTEGHSTFVSQKVYLHPISTLVHTYCFFSFSFFLLYFNLVWRRYLWPSGMSWIMTEAKHLCIYPKSYNYFFSEISHTTLSTFSCMATWKYWKASYHLANILSLLKTHLVKDLHNIFIFFPSTHKNYYKH